MHSLRSHNHRPQLLRRRIVQQLALAIIFPLPAGCGFRLRGSREPIGFSRAMVVDTSNGSLTLAEQLRRELATRYNVEIVSRRTEAQVVVHLDEVQFNRIVVGFSRAGRPREIELRMALLLRIEDAQGSLLQPAGQLELRRTVAIADADVISTDDAERFQREVMTQDLLQQIMRRLGRIGHDAGSARPR